MRIKGRLLACVLPLLFASQVSLAEKTDSQWIAGVSGGTLGIGPEVSYRFSPHLGIRANAAFLSYNDSDEIDEVDYDAELKLNSYGVLLDWYPTGGGLRISLGGRFNNNDVELEGRPATNVEIGNQTFTPQQVGVLTGTIAGENDFAPTLTLGYGGTLAQGFTMGVEVGVVAQGSPKINNLRATGGTFSNNPILQSQLAAEEQNIEDDADNYEYWPVLQVHFLYRF
jgi:hypothetical protein